MIGRINANLSNACRQVQRPRINGQNVHLQHTIHEGGPILCPLDFARFAIRRRLRHVTENAAVVVAAQAKLFVEVFSVQCDWVGLRFNEWRQVGDGHVIGYHFYIAADDGRFTLADLKITATDVNDNSQRNRSGWLERGGTHKFHILEFNAQGVHAGAMDEDHCFTDQV